MHYQENTSFDQCQGHTKCCPVPATLCDLCTGKFDVATSLDLDLGVKVTRNVAQCPLHHVTYAPIEFEVTTSKALRGEAFTRNSIFDL